MNRPIPLPANICDECLQTALDGLQQGSAFAVMHCGHESTGAIFEQSLGLWRTFSPVTRDTFAEFVAREFKVRAALAGAGEHPAH